MNVESITVKLSQLETRVKKLLESYHFQQEELLECRNENEVLRRQLDFKNEEIKNFENQDKISKIANVVADDKKLSLEFKNKINEYIKEVEKGLAYLNRV